MKHIIKPLLFSFLMMGFTSCDNEKQSMDCIDPDKIKPDQPCIEIYQPVCGCDNKTYSNNCFAEINGVSEWTSGECES